MEMLLAGLVIIIIGLWLGVQIVPEQQMWIIERMGKYNCSLDSGLSFIIPMIDRVAYKHTLKERAIDVFEQAAITRDNVTLLLDGILYVRVINAVDASYGVENPFYAVTQLAQTSMRSAIGKLSMDTTFEERDSLNSQIVAVINEAATTWGIQCMRYEIKDIKPPVTVIKAMEMQMAAERQKRAEILESEGKKQAIINLAEASKTEIILNSEGARTDQVNRAKGEAEAIQVVAEATAYGIEKVATAIQHNGGEKAVSLRVAEQYIEAFKELAKESNTLIIPADSGNASSMIAQAMTIFDNIKTHGASPKQVGSAKKSS